MRLRYENDIIAAYLSAQLGRHANTTVNQVEAHAPLPSIAGSGSTSLFAYMLSPSMSGYPITVEVRSLSTWPSRQS